MTDINLEKEIISYCTNNTNKLIPQRCTIFVLKKHNWYNYLLQKYTDNVSKTEKLLISETLYRIINNIEIIPKCKICGNSVNYTPGRGYANYCSKKCQNSDSEILSKNAKGVSLSLKNAYKNKGNEIKEKRKKTLIKYGGNTSSPFSSSEIREKAKDKIKELYGVENVMFLPEYHKSTKNISRNKSVLLWKNRGYDIKYLDNDKVLIKNCCNKHGDVELSLVDFCNRMKEERRNNSVICPICHPINTYSGEEQSMAEFLDSLNVNYIKNDRKQINPLELDFYFPEYKLAIEMNGLLYHSELFKKDKNYHLNKQKLCKEKGIRLLYIWEDEWVYKTDIVKSMIRNILGKTENRIYARNCKICELSSKDYNCFVQNNHLQGAVNSKYKFGLIYNNEIVSVMGFGDTRISLGGKSNNRICELYRYCCKKDTIIIGAASKLFKYAVNVLKSSGYQNIISYAKKDFSEGFIYNILRFEKDSETAPGYFWTNGHKRINRFSVRKSELVKAGENKDKTESEIMHNRNFYKCYDTGNIKFIYKI